MQAIALSTFSRHICRSPRAMRIPASAASGNSSGVAFADFTGDGWADLYVGKSGDRYLGAANVLLVNDGTGCFTDQTATRIPGEPSRDLEHLRALRRREGARARTRSPRSPLPRTRGSTGSRALARTGACCASLMTW